MVTKRAIASFFPQNGAADGRQAVFIQTIDNGLNKVLVGRPPFCGKEDAKMSQA